MSDVVYTPPWVAADMIDHFNPTGTTLDPCRGLGAFHDLLPNGSPWCEITDGEDFYNWNTAVDWVIGNPPYSMTRAWFRHSYTIAENLLYLIPLRNLFSGYGFVREVYEFGGIAGIRAYGTGNRLGFPMGNAVGAVHIRRGYTGPCNVTFFDDLVRENDLFSTREECAMPTCINCGESITGPHDNGPCYGHEDATPDEPRFHTPSWGVCPDRRRRPMNLVSVTIGCPHCDREFHQIDTTRERAGAIVEAAVDRHIAAEHAQGMRCDAQYGHNPDRCYLQFNHRGSHSNQWGTTWSDTPTGDPT